MRKRYMLFTWAQYYPGGAPSDAKGTFDTSEEAQKAWTSDLYREDHAAVLDLDTAEWCWRST